jgi:hypothetical protein
MPDRCVHLVTQYASERAAMAATSLLLALSMAVSPAPAGAQGYAISAHGYSTAADVRPHARLALDVAEIRGLVSGFPPDFAAALARYAFGRHFSWRDSSHSLAFFADDYHNRMARVLPGAIPLFGADAGYQHRFMTAAFMGTGLFEGSGSRRSASSEARVAAIDTGMLALVLNWCRLELSEASIRGPRNNNWSLADGSPKNWSELFAFWYGSDGRHSPHESMSRIVARFTIEQHPTAALAASLAAGQRVVVARSWPEDHAHAIAATLDVAALLVFLDRIADLGEGLSAGGATAQASVAALRAAWLAAADTLGRADADQARAVHAMLFTGREPPNAAHLRAAVAAAAQKLNLARSRFGSAL